MEILLACRVMENFQEAKTAASGLENKHRQHVTDTFKYEQQRLSEFEKLGKLIQPQNGRWGRS